MNIRARFIGLLIASASLMSCQSTQLLSMSKDPTYQVGNMRHVFVMAIVRRHAIRVMIEDEFVQKLNKRNVEAVASHTIVPEGQTLEREAWKQIIQTNHFDAVIITRLTNMEVIEKDVDAKFLNAETGNGYGYYYGTSRVMYQPGFTIRKETAAIETRVFDAASDKMMWTAHTKTKIEQGGDPETQIRRFVKQMLKRIYS